jgi:membrane associated rhomboid family serine protease
MLILDDNRLTRIRTPFVTWGLMAAAVLCFLLQQGAGGQALEEALAFQAQRFRAAPLDPAMWPGLVGHVLLHGDWLHLAGNLIVLFAFGDNVEDALGHLRYALFLALSAAAAAIAYAVLDAAPAEWLIGASGAIAGVLGGYLLLWPMARTLFLAAKVLPVLVPAFWLVGFWLALDVIGAAFLRPGKDEATIAWWAHLGGFAAGLLLVVLLRPAGVALLQPPAPSESPFWRKKEGRMWIDLVPHNADDPLTRGEALAAATAKGAGFVLVMLVLAAFGL